MEQCPVCNAKYIGDPICYRCKTDLSPLVDIERKSASHLEDAVSAFNSNNFEQMFFHAKRAYALRQTPAAVRLLACASVILKKFDIAMYLWKSK